MRVTSKKIYSAMLPKSTRHWYC